MANKFFTAPVRMESQYVDTKLHTVLFQNDGENAPVTDGTLVVLGDFVKDPVYVAAYTSANSVGTAPVDINTRAAKAPASAAVTGVCIIDLPTVPTAVGQGNTYRMGVKTIGLTADAGVPVRARKLVVDDTYVIGEENCTAPLTVGQYAKVNATTGKHEPDSSAGTANFIAKVVDKHTVSQGINPNVTAYTLCVVRN